MKYKRFPKYKRGDIYYVDFGNQPGSVVCGMHPAIIVQNNVGNWHSSTVIVAAISTGIPNSRQATHVKLGGRFGLNKCSVLLTEQLLTVDKAMVYQFLGHASRDLLEAVDLALITSLGLQSFIDTAQKREKQSQNPPPT